MSWLSCPTEPFSDTLLPARVRRLLKWKNRKFFTKNCPRKFISIFNLWHVVFERPVVQKKESDTIILSFFHANTGIIKINTKNKLKSSSEPRRCCRWSKEAADGKTARLIEFRSWENSKTFLNRFETNYFLSFLFILSDFNSVCIKDEKHLNSSLLTSRSGVSFSVRTFLLLGMGRSYMTRSHQMKSYLTHPDAFSWFVNIKKIVDRMKGSLGVVEHCSCHPY